MAKQQNIYDDQQFFEGYLALREKENSYNTLLDEPAIVSLLPDLKDKTVLDMGCGFGDNCRAYIKKGAKQTVGIDISENMIRQAKKADMGSKAAFYVMPMQDIKKLGQTFDVIVSSLAIHYVKEYDALMNVVAECLNPGGVLVFSQEHPIATAPLSDVFYTCDEQGKAQYFHLQDYGYSGLRVRNWFKGAKDAKSYHRTMAQVLNGIIQAGLTINKVVEPLPTPEAMKKNDGLYKEYIKPSFLAIRAIKL